MWKKRFNLLIMIILCLAVFGSGLILKAYDQYIDRFIEVQDARQLQLSKAVDRNLELLLRQCRDRLLHVLAMEDFRWAEEKWQTEGTTDALLKYLMPEPDALSADRIALQGDRVLLSVAGKGGYTFLYADTESDRRICRDQEGNFYLAMICDGQADIDYAALIDLQSLYQTVSSIELAESDQLLLMEKGQGLMLHFCTNELVVKSTRIESCPKRADFQLLMAAEETQVLGCHPFVYQTQRMKEGYNAHIVTIPSGESQNGSFAIGLINNIDEVLLPLREASIRWLAGGLVILLGVSLLLILVLRLRRRDAQTARELELLREKNNSIEELNRKMQESAHHQRLEIIGTLASGIAHEFNNLLTPIMGYSMLTLEQIPQEQEELYNNVLEIYNTSRKAREITTQLSQYSRKNSAEKRFLQPDHLISRVMRVAMPACPKPVSVQSLPGAGQAMIYGDETQLSQLFLNLMLNAFQAMQEGAGSLQISTGVERGQVVVRLRDTGCGIAEDVLPHIFEPFFTTKEGGRGSGLGLAIARQIAEDHQGRIDVESEVGVGTVFTVRLPVYYR